MIYGRANIPQCNCKAISQELAKRKSFFHIAGRNAIITLACITSQRSGKIMNSYSSALPKVAYFDTDQPIIQSSQSTCKLFKDGYLETQYELMKHQYASMIFKFQQVHSFTEQPIHLNQKTDIDRIESSKISIIMKMRSNPTKEQIYSIQRMKQQDEGVPLTL